MGKKEEAPELLDIILRNRFGGSRPLRSSCGVASTVEWSSPLISSLSHHSIDRRLCTCLHCICMPPCLPPLPLLQPQWVLRGSDPQQQPCGHCRVRHPV